MARIARSSLVFLTVVLIGCGGGDTPAVTSASLEETIRPKLEDRLAGIDGPATTLDSLDCVRKSDSEGSCVAVYSDTDGGSATSQISVDIDPGTGDVVWRQEPVESSP